MTNKHGGKRNGSGRHRKPLAQRRQTFGASVPVALLLEVRAKQQRKQLANFSAAVEQALQQWVNRR